MPKCTWRAKPGAAENCGMMTDADSDLCPRHKVLQKLSEAKEEEKHRKRVLERKVVTAMPHTRRELVEQGYQLTGSGNCRECDAHIEWWRTPNGRPSPWNSMEEVDSPARSHFATCIRASAFRKAS